MHGRPADLRRQPGEEEHIGDEREVRIELGVGQRSPRQGLETASPGSRQHENSEQGDAEAERGEDEVLPARLERAGAAAEADEESRRGRRRFDRKPGGAEVAGERNCEQHGPEGKERHPVDTLGVVRLEQRAVAEHLRRDECAGEADDPDHPDEQAAGRIDDDPAAEERVTGVGQVRLLRGSSRRTRPRSP